MGTFAESVQHQGVDAALMARLTRVGVLRVFSAGETVFSQGMPREWFGVVMAGRIELTEGRHGDPRRVATLEPGAMISEGFLFGEEKPHHLNAKAMTPAEVLICDRGATDRIQQDEPEAWGSLVFRVAQRLRDRLRSVDMYLAGHMSSLELGSTRSETDALGTRDVPDNVYYGIHTLRALENFPVSGRALRDYGQFVTALAHVKKAAAQANVEFGLLDAALADAIVAACDEIIGGALRHNFVVDMISGGAGMAANMCANEVIANRALEILGFERGQYQHLNALDHVNLSQSTNDVFPTAVRIALQFSLRDTVQTLDHLADELRGKEREFADVLKVGRTENQDAVPMTLGQEFGAWEGIVRSARRALADAAEGFERINMGATVVGTGLNSPPGFAQCVVTQLARNTGLRLVHATDLVEATQDTGAYVTLSGALKRVATQLSKISNDLRWLSSGPRAGLGEIHLPSVMHGSSVIPGKVNPIIPEAVNMACYQVMGFDTAVGIATATGELELTMAEPLIAYDLLQMLSLVSNAADILANRCVNQISVNRDVCEGYVRDSIGLVTALVPVLGRERSLRVAREALATGSSVYDLVVGKGWLTAERVTDLLDPSRMTRPAVAMPEPLADTAEIPIIPSTPTDPER